MVESMRSKSVNFAVLWIIVFSAVSFFSSLGKNICEYKYQIIHPEHSMCILRNSTCKFRHGTEENIQPLLNFHNQIRNSIKVFVGHKYPEGRNMPDMEWDHELYLIAQQYALQCAEKPDCLLCHQIDRFHVEQNYAVKTFSSVNIRVNRMTERFKAIIKEWVQELNKYEPTIIERFHNRGFPTNWTNILRSTTTKVGCASMSFERETSDKITEVYMCNYGPAKLVEGERIYEPKYMNCSNCPNGLICDINGLCKKQETSWKMNNMSLISGRLLKYEGYSNSWNNYDHSIMHTNFIPNKRETTESKECSAEYQNFTRNHSMCKPDKAGCDFSRTYLRYRDRLLHVHNTIRNSIAKYGGIQHQTATNMKVMEWDNELYEMARLYVIQCIQEPDCKQCHQSRRFPVEQNFAVKTFMYNVKRKKSGERFVDVVMEWAKEMKDYLSGDTQSISQKIVDGDKKSWTNIFRAKTYKIGCASISFNVTPPPEEVIKEIYICNYGPAILSEGEQLYEFGTSCSNCEKGFSCDKTYTNLCNRLIPSSINTTTEVVGADNLTNLIQESSESIADGKINVTNDLLQLVTESVQTDLAVPSDSCIIWNCTISWQTEKVCEFEEQCYNAWRISAFENEIYLEIDIPENEKTALLFHQNIFIDSPSCFTFSYTKDSLDYWSFMTSTLFGIAVRTDSNEHVMVQLHEDSLMWRTAALDIPWKDVFIQVGIAIKSYAGVGKQEIHVKDFIIVCGNCTSEDCI
uniref:Cysteine-rich secretory protein n=1 Tax=Hadrurus spadix TaxID=141984 RepID=A0A1W7RAR1_9SCOR